LTCLRSSGARSGMEDAASCTGDVAGYGRRPEVVAMIDRLGLSPGQVKFTGCSKFPFSADGVGRGDRFTGTITYPLRGSKRFRQDYLTPIAHELGHAVQLRETGSRRNLTRLLDSRSVELGADFLAGFSVRALGAGLNITSFAAHLDLAGQFEPTPDDHGRPLLRANAFRRGFHRVDNQAPASPERMHLEFQIAIRREIGGVDD
jgi:hypothetical protein